MQSRVELPVRIVTTSLLCPTGMNASAIGMPATTGAVPNFKARSMVPDRKSLKLMTQAVRLGVACIADAVNRTPQWDGIAPERRGMYVGASPQVGRHDDLADAFKVASESGVFSLQDFGEKGIEQIHPLWLVRGLSNNVLGFSSAYHNAQGHNMSYAMGIDGGWNAILEGAHALVDNRLDIVVVGASDDLTEASEVLGAPGSQGAAFFVMERADTVHTFDRSRFETLIQGFGQLGAASIPIGMALQEFSN